ncbi:MAG: B12-binding domain-containing radical SAM protein [bacterium]|nr:B12-binding domain-containing radical SAM protein [bacterium]
MIEPIDLLSLATYIRQEGHMVEVLDMDVKRMDPKDISIYLHDRCFDVLVMLLDYHIPLHTDLALAGVVEVSKKARERDVKVVIAGKMAMNNLEEIFWEGSPVNVAISGEAEVTLKRLLMLDKWTSGALKDISNISFYSEGKVQTTVFDENKINLDEIPIPDRSLLNLKDYIDARTLISSRGCIQTCTFCHVPGFWGRWRGRKASVVVDEIEYLIKKYEAKKILFLDDNAMASPLRMREISAGIIKRNLKVALGCLGSISVFDEKTASLMYKAGFRWIHFGIESGDDRILKKIRKNISMDKVIPTIREAKKIGMRVRTSWILDLPGIDKEAFDNTIKAILETKTDEIRLHFYALRYGSALHDKYSRKSKNSAQYLHNGSPSSDLNGLDKDYMQTEVNKLVKKLEEDGYIVVRNQEESKKLEKMDRDGRKMKIVSFCPLRYTVSWKL